MLIRATAIGVAARRRMIHPEPFSAARLQGAFLRAGSRDGYSPRTLSSVRSTPLRVSPPVGVHIAMSSMRAP